MWKQIPKPCRILLTALFWIGVWELAALIYGKPILFPYPHEVGKRLLNLLQTEDFYTRVLRSLANIFAGTVAALVAATLTASLTARVSFLRELFSPLMTVVKATPVASFIILLWLLIGAVRVPSVITFLMVFPVVWTNVDAGFAQIDPHLADVCRVYRFSGLRKLRYLTVPSVAPYFISACRTSIGLAWKAGIAAEIIATPRGTIGNAITDAKTYIEYTDMFAWTFSVIVLSLLLEFGFSALLRLLAGKFHFGEAKL